MQILVLAKELGIPYERLIAWCGRNGFPYKNPEDDVDSKEVERIRRIFAMTSKQKDADASLEESFDTMMGDSDLDLSDFPKTLEELEALERSLLKDPEVPGRRQAKADRVPFREILKQYGIAGKSTLKRLRKLLPEHIARLFNHESLVEEQAAFLREALEQKIPLCCDNPTCQALIRARSEGRQGQIRTDIPAHCRICKGSTARRSLEEMAFYCTKAAIKRILVLGGAPATHKEVNNLAPQQLEFRLIAGDVARDRQRASADLKWCDIVVLWAGTILGHEVSNQYLKGKKGGVKPVIVAKRRSVEALCAEVIAYLKRSKEST
ncbi:MAG: hypothetical protein ACYTG7_06225 [Planctomycetota bacterium]|jgi:hypothetical protein